MGGNYTKLTQSKDEVKFKKKVSKMQSSFTARIVNKMKGEELTADERQKPASEVVGTRKRDKAWRGTKIAAHYGDKITEPIIDTSGASMDTLGSLMDYASGGKERTWGMVGNSASEDKWGDMGLQSEGVPIVGATIKAIKILIDTGKYIKDMVDFARDNKKDADGHTSTTTGEKFEVLKKTLELFMSGVDLANSIMSTFTTFLGRLPIAGAVMGTISNCVSFGANMATLIKSGKSIHRMRAQKKDAKKNIFDNQEANTGFVRTEEHKSLFKSKPTTKNKVNREFGMVKDEAASEKTGRAVHRNMRLDEKTKQMREENLSGEREKLVQDLEDYDVTKELTSANKKRARQGITDLIFKDAAGIATSLATLDPTGMGAGVGAAISGAVTIGYAAKDVAVKGRQMLRNRGKFGADVNKSDANKEQRRHNLAVIMYDRLNALKNAPLKDNYKDTDAQANLAKWTEADERISALGVAGPLFRAAGDKGEMLTVMRKGFYRENN